MIKYYYSSLVCRFGTARHGAGSPRPGLGPNGMLQSLGGIQAGVTLVELLIVLVMASIVLTLGVPSLQTLIQRNRITADTNRFVTSMMLARSEAVKRNTPTGIAAQGGSWTNGWVVWVDADDDGVQDGGELVLRNVSGLNTSVTLSSSGSVTVFRYAADGTLNTTDTLDVCDSSTTGETGRRLALAVTGRVSVDPDITCP